MDDEQGLVAGPRDVIAPSTAPSTEPTTAPFIAPPTAPSTAPFDDLVGTRVRIRRLRPDDVGALTAYRSDTDVARYQSWEPPFTEDDARALVAATPAQTLLTPGEWTQLAVADVRDDAVLGDIGVHCGTDPRLVSIGVTLAPAAQGRGLATEALVLVLDHLFGACGVHRVSADCDARNTASARLLTRLGLRHEGTHLQASWWKGEWTDDLVFAVLASEWPARRPPLG